METAFYQDKMQTLAYFFRYELPKIEGLTRIPVESDGLTIRMNESCFAD